MKKTFSKHIKTSSWIILFLLFVCCKGNGTSQLKEPNTAVATVILDDGSVVDFSGKVVSPSKGIGGISFSMTDYGLVFMLRINSNYDQEKEKQNELEIGSYYLGNSEKENDLGRASISLQEVSPMGPPTHIDERYSSNDGSGSLNITAVSEDEASGTFSTILYSPSGKKITIKDAAFIVAFE